MSETAPAPPAASAKTPKKKSSIRTKKPGASLSDLISKAVSESKERRGVSLPAIKKYLANNNYDIEKNKNRIKTTLKALVENGVLQQATGSGASGSFKMGKKPETKKVKKAAPKTKKAVTKKPVVKKTKKVAAKKSIAKKSPKTAKKAVATKKKQSPIKAKKTTVKKSQSPRKIKTVKKKAIKPKTKTRKTPAKKK